MEDKSEDRVAIRPASTAVVLWPKVALQSLGSVVSSVPGAWHLPVPASSSLGAGDVSEQRKGSLGWEGHPGLLVHSSRLIPVHKNQSCASLPNSAMGALVA